MRRRRGWTTIAALTCWALCLAPALAVDLTKAGRKLTKEPEYKTQTPAYCLAVFGRQAKLAVWLVLDGDALYVDRNGNGDLTEAGEKITAPEDEQNDVFCGVRETNFEIGDLTTVVGKSAWHDVSVWKFDDEDDEAEHILISATGEYEQWAVPKLGNSPETAPIVHFGGPLTIRLASDNLVTGAAGEELYAEIGTPGVGEDTFASISYETIPAELYPLAEIELPAVRPGGKAFLIKVVLDGRC
ncbi:MAG TPA: hypothetical protein VJ783_24195 [Pirellulales bacterium]|nr:hypothetical protein [Pirellulales bacterium]